MEEKWIVTAGNRKEMDAWKRGKFHTNYIHSRNLKIHKNFSYLKFSNIKCSSVLLKQERSKNGGSGKSFNFLIVVGALMLTFFNTEFSTV